jgi:NDP-sugar pyrophosphorylase family protein
VDILSTIDLREVARQHSLNGSAATLVCSKRVTNRYLLLDNHNRLCGWINKKTGETKSPFTGFKPANYTELAFSGIQMMQPDMLNEMNTFPDRFSIIDYHLSKCATYNITAYQPVSGSILDVGKADSLCEAAQFLNLLT